MQCHRLTCCDGRTRKKKSLCVHTKFLHSAHQTLRAFVVAEDIQLSQVKYKYKFDDSHKLTDEKRPSHADSSGRKCLQKYDDQFTPSTSIPSDQFYDTMEITSSTTMKMESASREEPNADALYGPGGCGKIY